MSDRAVVTLVLGDDYRARFEAACLPSWRRYAERNDYDLVVLTDPLDDSERAQARSPSWQKLLVPEQPFAQGYEQLVWVDADVVMNPEAGPLHGGVPTEKVGAVDEYGSPSPEIHPTLGLRRTPADNGGWRPETAADYYADAGLSPAHPHVVQGGVLVHSPRCHAAVFRRIYDDFEDVYRDYEMSALSWTLQETGVLHLMDPSRNTMWAHYKLQHAPFLAFFPDHPDRARKVMERALRDNHLLHFAGDFEQLPDGLEPAPPEHPPRVRPRRGDLETPVVMIIFRRPGHTARVFEAIREQRPRRLLVVADGPRAGVDGDEEACAAARAAVLERIDWDCHVQTDLADTNLGLKRRVETGLDWALAEAGEAIVLEDDCLPAPWFFPFCSELLARYRDDDRVMSISGTNIEFDTGEHRRSYFFSRYPQVWGWATWERAWRHYDPDPHPDGAWLAEALDHDPLALTYWRHVSEQTAAGQIDTWDYPWTLSTWRRRGLSVHPSVNLVTNIGFDDDATNTKAGDGSIFAAMPTRDLPAPLVHPDHIERDAVTDDFIERTQHSGNLQLMFRRVRAARAATS